MQNCTTCQMIQVQIKTAMTIITQVIKTQILPGRVGRGEV